jgi:hypothetical protein
MNSTTLRMRRLAAAFLAFVPIALSAAHAASTPTPVPGGAMQASGVQGGFGSWLFNGVLRVKPVSLTVAKPGGTLFFDAGKRWLVFRAIAKNGMNQPYTGYQFKATIVDADGISYSNGTITGVRPDVDLVPGLSVENIPPGAGWKVQIPFEVPEDFIPAKIILADPYDAHRKVFRIVVRKKDLKG